MNKDAQDYHQHQEDYEDVEIKELQHSEFPKSWISGNYQLNPVSLSDFLEEDIPERKMMMSPWLPEGGICMIYASRGIGKTYFALEIAVAVATGKPFHNWAVESRKRVLYIDGEMCQSDLQSRFKKTCGDNFVIDDDYFGIVTPERQQYGSPDISNALWFKSLDETTAQYDLIIVDNISTLCRGGNENDAESWSIVQEWAINLRSKGKAVVFIHHAGKGGNQRGTSKREDVMDTVIALKRPEDYRTMEGARFIVSFEKARHFSGSDAEPFEMKLVSNDSIHGWTVSNLPEDNYQKYQNLDKTGMKDKDVAEQLGLSKASISKYKCRALQES